MNRRSFLWTPVLAAGAQLGQSQTGGDRERWIATAESLKPRLHEARHTPVSIVKPVADSSRFLRWRMETASPAASLRGRSFRRGDAFILDFGRHLTGRLSFSLAGTGEAVDAPPRLRLTFGEVPEDVATPLETYAGTLAKGWLPDETINVDFLPQHVEAPRRHAFRYVKFDVVDTSPNFAVQFDRVEALSVTSAGDNPAPLAAPDGLRRLDQVSLATLRDCMQTVFEDGPRRDRRLWIGDLRLQALTNYVTFRNHDLVKRCLYLFAGLPREDGLLAACVYDEPKPLCGRQYIMDYAVLFAATLLDYARATGDSATARDLWPVVRRQMELVGRFVNRDGLFADPGGWWIFIDWRDELDKTAAMHGVLLFCYRQAAELARMAGAESDASAYGEIIARMLAAARSHLYDSTRQLFVSGKERQVSWSTQAWMILSGVPTRQQAEAALRAVMKHKEAIRPGTPYLYHYVVEAMLTCGMKAEALDLLRSYWGGMVDAGADTFWEVYDPSNSLLSPYKSVLVNSYCHAWSCTPAYFLRGRGLA